MSDIGERLLALLKEKDISYGELSDMTGIPKSALHRYVTGATEKIPIDRVKSLAFALGVTPEYILGWDRKISNLDIAVLQMYPDFVPGKNFLSDLSPLPKIKKVPLLGTIACGEPILADENIEMYIGVDESIPADFALKCKGDSMINARIFDGDIVYIRQQSDVEDGEIAAVLIGDSATLKKVHKYPNKVVLSACNPMYDDYIYTGEQLSEIRILGKAVAFFSIIR